MKARGKVCTASAATKREISDLRARRCERLNSVPASGSAAALAGEPLGRCLSEERRAVGECGDGGECGGDEKCGVVKLAEGDGAGDSAAEKAGDDEEA